MKKFIEALKKAGIYDHIVETIVDVRNRYGAKDATKGITMILKTEMIRNPKLLDVFMESVVDIEKVDAMKDVNPDELFKKATEHGDSGLKKSNEEALEDAVVGNFIDFLNGIANMLND